MRKLTLLILLALPKLSPAQVSPLSPYNLKVTSATITNGNLTLKNPNNTITLSLDKNSPILYINQNAVSGTLNEFRCIENLPNVGGQAPCMTIEDLAGGEALIRFRRRDSDDTTVIPNDFLAGVDSAHGVAGCYDFKIFRDAIGYFPFNVTKNQVVQIGVSANCVTPTAGYGVDISTTTNFQTTVNLLTRAQDTTGFLEGQGNTNAINANNVQWPIASTDGATQAAGCLGIITSNSDNSLAWTSTTTANASGMLGITSGSCTPGSVCNIYVRGYVQMTSSGAFTNGNCIETSTVRCQAGQGTTPSITCKGAFLQGNSGSGAINGSLPGW